MPKIYETNNNSKVLPKPGTWIRIKNGLYDKDLAVVEHIINDDKLYAKLIPRIDTF
jgi:hypothetical protein